MTLKIFVADDSVTIQKIVSLAFCGEDALIEAASDGDSALDSIRVFKPDVVLADVCMPGRNGYDLCASIKEDPALSHTPVLLLVGAFEPYDEQEAGRVQSDGRLTKPFDTEELIQTIRALAGGRLSPEPAEPPAYAEGTGGLPAAGALKTAQGARGPVNARIWNSFLGAERILDLFDTDAGSMTPAFAPSIQESTQTIAGIQISEEIFDAIVDRVVRRMSADVVREVAWEVVPELSEVIIRRTLEEHNKS